MAFKYSQINISPILYQKDTNSEYVRDTNNDRIVENSNSLEISSTDEYDMTVTIQEFDYWDYRPYYVRKYQGSANPWEYRPYVIRINLPNYFLY